jgi:Uncharacterized protein/domain associated with GTPases
MANDNNTDIGKIPVGIDLEKMLEVVQDVAGNIERTQSKIGVVVVGSTGSGKSTLLNAMFGRKLAKTGIGGPQTKAAEWWPKERDRVSKGLPFRVLDTKGLEEKNYKGTLEQLLKSVDKANASEKPEKHAHIAWLTIKQGSARIQESHKQVVEELDDRKVPVIAVLTAALYEENNFDDILRKEIPRLKDVILVNSIEAKTRSGHIAPFGLEELLEATNKCIPEAQAEAMIRAVRVGLKKKRDLAEKAVHSAAAASAAAAATPVPFSDAALLIPIQTGMIAGISSAYGMTVNKDALIPIASSIAGCVATTVAGRFAFGAILKAVPGIGSLLGGILNAGVAVAFTEMLGHLYIELLENLCKMNDGNPPSVEQVADAFPDFWKTRGKNIELN